MYCNGDCIKCPFNWNRWCALNKFRLPNPIDGVIKPPSECIHAPEENVEGEKQ